MRILIIRNYPSYLDLDKNNYNIQEIGLAKALSKKGHVCDVLLWTNHEEKTLEINVEGYNFKIKIYYKRGINILKNALFCGCKRIFDMYDVLQVCEYNQIQSWMIAKRYPQKTIIYHGPYYSKNNIKYNLMSLIVDLIFLKDYKKQNTPFLTKSFLAEDYLKKKGLNNTQCVGVGLDVDKFYMSKADRNNFICDVMSRSEDIILYVGKIEPRRNTKFLIDILKELCYFKKTILVMIGTGYDKNVRDFFKCAREKGVISNIMYCESIEQKYMASLYSCSSALVLPTKYDIFGMVILEAMYFKKSVFTTLNGGSNMLVNNEENGFIINGFDAKEWASHIKNVINDEHKMQIIGEKAHNTVNSYFTWDILSEKFLHAYRCINTDSINNSYIE